MGLYRRKDSPVWWMSFCVDKRQYQMSTGTSDKQIAQTIYDAIKGKIAIGKWIPELREDEKPKEYTFIELSEKYKAWAEGRQKAFKRWKSYLIAQLVKKFGDLFLNDFSTEVIEQYQSEMLSKGNKPATVNRKIAVLAHIFTKAADWKMIDSAAIPKVKMLKEDNKRLRYLSKEECQALINACEPHLKPIVITALNTGMRKGEILNLRWDANIDLRHGFILLDKTKNGERREIPINDTLRGVLQGITRRLDISHVFYDNFTGKPYGDVKRAFATACRRAGIKDFRFHDLRHTFASHLVMAGVDLTTVKELLGHKTLTMTLRYAHLAPSHKVEAVKKYDNFLNGKTPQNEGQNQLKYYNSMTVTKGSLTANA
jgi:integrase